MKLTETQKKVYELICSGVTGKAGLMVKTGISHTSITRIIEDLIAEGFILSTASGYFPRSSVVPVEYLG